MSAHTPGPWKAYGSAVHADNGREIIFGRHNTRSAEKEEREANARLIASAPDLLAALKDLEEAWAHVRLMPCDGRSHGPDATEECEECGNASALSKRAEAARVAIAKAEGKP